MVTLLEINKAINDKINAALVGTDLAAVPIVASDISEPIVRPSLKVQFESSKNGLFNSQCREKTLKARVYFFASDLRRYKSENAEMQDLIETAFLDELEIEEGYFIPINEVDSETINTVLTCKFELYCLDILPSADPDNDMTETMDELYLEL